MLKIEEYILYSSDRIVLSIPDIIFAQGSFTYIHGSNSSGKSLFLKSLCGKYRNFQGHLGYKEFSLSSIQNQVFFIDNDLPVIKELDFLGNIELSIGKLSTIQKNKLIDMASVVGLIDKLKDRMEYSSRSERMLMYLLRACIICPNVLLIDDIDDYFDDETFVKVYQIMPYCLKSGMILISTGKSAVENLPSYEIVNSELKMVT